MSKKQNPTTNCSIDMFRGCCTLQGVQCPVYTMTCTPALLHKPTYLTSLYLHFYSWYTWPTIIDDFYDMVWWTCTSNGHHLVKGITIFMKIMLRFLVFLWLVCTWQADKWLVCGHAVSFVTSSGELWTQLWEGRHFGRCTWVWISCGNSMAVTWFLDAFVKCTGHRDMTYMHLAPFLTVWYVRFVLCSAEVVF